MTAPADDLKRPAEGEVAATSPADASAAFSDLVRQVAACHASDELHLQVAPEHLVETDIGQWSLQSFTDQGDATVSASGFPPEFSSDDELTLPRNLSTAAKRLRGKGDPRRIDLYGLGRVACWLFADATEQEYLRSPTTAARVPAALRPVVDGLLGHNASRRYACCDEVLTDLTARSDSLPAHADTPPLGTGADLHRNTPRPPAARPDSTLPFEKLGHYEVRRRLGGGGMGDVYEAYDPTLDRLVAIKVLPPELARNRDYVDRFRSEAQAVAKLSHPNLVPIHFIGSDGPTHYFAMRLVAGPSLAGLLAERGSLGQGESLALVRQIVAGLREAHRRGLIHRDIKPGNVLIDSERNAAMLADFGLVKSLGASAAMTATGVVMGTVDYIAPEQGRGKEVDERSDLYSIGVLLYQMLSGRLPFQAESATAMIFQHAYEAPPSLAATAPSVCDDLVRIVARLMEKNPADRYASADALLAELDLVNLDKVDSRAAEIRIAPSEKLSRSLAATTPFYVPRPLGWRRQLLAFFNRRAPEQLRELQNTQLQIDGGIAVYEERREKLVALANESTDIERELERQVAANEASDAQGDEALREQLAKQQEESAAIQTQLSEVDAVLARLRSERDVLVARLRVAEAAGSGDQPKPWASKLLVATVGLPLLFTGIGVLIWTAAFQSPVTTLSRPVVAEPSQPPVHQEAPTPPTSRENVERTGPRPLSDGLVSAAYSWSKPEVVTELHANPADDANLPWVSADGLTMFFASHRGGRDGNLWQTHRRTIDSPWGKPEKLPEPINTQNHEGSPSLFQHDEREHLFFERRKRANGGQGDADIYVSTRSLESEEWSDPVPVEATQTDDDEFNPFIAADGLELYYGSYRDGGQGRRDIWRVRREAVDQPWSEPMSVGPAVNTAGDQFTPRATADGRALLVSSDRDEGNLWKDIWLTTRSSSDAEFTNRTRLRLPFNQWEDHKGGAFLSADGKTLWFQSGRKIDGVERRRIWVSQRTKRPEPYVGLTTRVPAPPISSEAIAALTSDDYQWTEPQNLGDRINTEGPDSDPWVSADGLTLMYTSMRPGGVGNADIWVARRSSSDDEWGEPENLGREINSGEWDSSASMTADGLTLVLNSYRKGGQGNSDLYISQRESRDAPWPRPVNMGAPVNTSDGEWSPAITPDGLAVYFSTIRPGGVGFVDNWVTTRESRWAPWKPPINLGIWLNSPQEDWCPLPLAGGKLLMFHSKRPGGHGSNDIYFSTRNKASDPWGLPRPLGGPVNTPHSEGAVFMSQNSKTVWFSSGRPGSLGDGDLWVSKLVPKKN